MTELEELLDAQELTETEKEFLYKILDKRVELNVAVRDDEDYYNEDKLFGLAGVSKNTARVWVRILEGKNLVSFVEDDYFSQPIVQFNWKLKRTLAAAERLF